jgi:HEXXH motif-containing protein
VSGTPSSTHSSALAEQIRRALRGDEPLWWPGLAAGLREDLGRELHAAGWSLETYGTHRWMASDPRAKLDTVGVVAAGSSSFVVEVLPQAAREVLADLPLAERVEPDAAERLQAAVDVVAKIHSLDEAIGSVVQSCHVLTADSGYDMSHSTPELPLSIFVSIPAANERHAVLRLAESLIHEAMHLQLTLIESSVPLVRSTSATAFSPWKGGDRPVQGLMHGLYVFAVIHDALGVLMRAAPGTRDYAEARRRDISAEVATMGDARPGLTLEGVGLWDRLVSRFDPFAPPAFAPAEESDAK